VASPYLPLLRAQLRSQLEYRASFALEVGMNALITTVDLVSLLVLFRVNPAFGGFTLSEALVIAGLGTFSFALADLLVGNIERLPSYVRTGLLDAVLFRPLGALPQLLIADLALRRLGRVAQTAVVLVLGLVLADIDWTPGRVALVVVAPVCGTAIFGALFLIGATFTFWLVDAREVASSFTYGGQLFATYPLTVFGAGLRRVFAYGLGLGFVAYLPALGLLGRSDPLGLPEWLRWCSPVAALGWVLAARLVWRFGIRHYGSTGS
jgi:ABC-2 type transport system permease protein